VSVEFGLHTEQYDDLCKLSIAGEVDVYTAPRLKEALIALIGGGCIHLIVDLEAVDFLDSSALGVLVGALRRIRERNGAIHIVCTRGSVLKLLKITRLDEAFPVYEDLEKAAVF